MYMYIKITCISTKMYAQSVYNAQYMYMYVHHYMYMYMYLFFHLSGDSFQFSLWYHFPVYCVLHFRELLLQLTHLSLTLSQLFIFTQ